MTSSLDMAPQRLQGFAMQRGTDRVCICLHCPMQHCLDVLHQENLFIS